MHQSIPGASLPPFHPPATVGHLPTLPVLGGGALAQFPHGSAFATPGATPGANPVLLLLVRASLSKHSKHGGFYWKHKQIQSSAGFELGFDHWGTICPLG